MISQKQLLTQKAYLSNEGIEVKMNNVLKLVGISIKIPYSVKIHSKISAALKQP